jgi:hypothetical protein
MVVWYSPTVSAKNGLCDEHRIEIKYTCLETFSALELIYFDFDTNIDVSFCVNIM